MAESHYAGYSAPAPEWMKGIKDKLDYGWRLYGNVSRMQPDTTVLINGFDAESEELLITETMKTKSLSSCFQCGVCSGICPSIPIAPPENVLSAQRMLHQGKLGLIDFADKDIWACATCGACVARCPRGVDIIDFMKSLRKIIVKLGVGYLPKSLRRAMGNLASVGNPFGEAPEKRGSWARDLGVKPFTKDMELLLFLGCYAGYDPRIRKVAQAIINIFQKADVSFGILGSEENCCGESANKVGNEDLFRKLAERNIRTFTEHGVTTVLTISPHCYNSFKNEYPRFGRRIEVIHYTQYLAELIEEGRLKFTKEVGQKVTYHDPCYLGRHNGIYDEPRQILNSIPRLELVEMPSSRENSLCCGGGGGRMWVDSEKDKGFSYARMQQASETGASILAVACPFCMLSLEASNLANNSNTIEIKSIAELVWEALKN